MKKLAAVLLVIGFTSATALGGVVEFAPDKLDVPQGESGSFTLTIEAVADFDSVDMIIGSHDLIITGFTYEPGVMDTLIEPPSPAGFYPSDLYTGGFNNPGIFNAPRTLYGVVTFDVPMGLPDGPYEIKVDSDFDAGISALGTTQGTDFLFGTGVVNVPEPATLGLLALGALGFIRRRK